MNTNETLPHVALEAVPRPRCPDDSTSLTEIFGRFLRLYMAEGDASPATIRTYHAQATQLVARCQQQRLSPSTATENGIIAYRKYLVQAGYNPTPRSRPSLRRRPDPDYSASTAVIYP